MPHDPNYYQQRAIDERRDLKERLEKLSDFVQKSEIYKSLSKEEQQLLRGQLFAMTEYYDLLDQRIKLWRL